jgi:penicillin-binding protein 1C
VRAAHRCPTRTLLDRHGTPLQTLRVDPSVHGALPGCRWQEMSPALLQAIVLSEDRRFWAHSGVDWAAWPPAPGPTWWNTRTRGASTLTMQLAGLIDDGTWRGRPAAAACRRSSARRWWPRSWSALDQEPDPRGLSQRVPWRGELVGVKALSQTLFGKHASGLDAHEAAMAAALVRGPNAAPGRVAERACGVLQRMQLSCDGVPRWRARRCSAGGGMPLGEQLAPHFARLASSATARRCSAARWTPALQRVAAAALRAQLAELQGRNVEDGAIVVLDNASGEVLAWVGASGAARRGAGRRRAGAAPAGIDAQALRLRPGLRTAAAHTGLAAGRFTGARCHRRRPVPAAELRPPVHRGWVSARRRWRQPERAGGARGAMLPPDTLHARLNAWAWTCRTAAAGTAGRWRWAAPT